MGCSYTGSAGGAIMIDTPNCANEMAGMASIRKTRNSKRILRILHHLAGSILRLPGPTLLLRAAWIERLRVDARIPRPRRLRLCTTAHFLWMRMKPGERPSPNDIVWSYMVPRKRHRLDRMERISAQKYSNSGDGA